MVKMTVQQRHLILVLSVILVVLTLSSCAGVRLISDYDEATDRSLTAIQQKTDDFVAVLIKKAGTADAAFDKHKDFYDDIDQQLRRLEFRVNSIPKNDKTILLVKKIRLVILGDGKCSDEGNSLRDLHCMAASKEKGPSSVALDINRRNINQTISAALSLEVAKKQGLE